ncbi:hypothetical protein SKAU_G00346190 [Synaphobranchus kaupii]|uniref:Uncharacterized protein n=1 Tax=Synaphobranchus kaupii TaxID=118154 RepID=A0A9Q1EJH6_SYNKA|nr:hypothetical protein SKAU_G00346190 [Synaphobranchus kaupii]
METPGTLPRRLCVTEGYLAGTLLTPLDLVVARDFGRTGVLCSLDWGGAQDTAKTHAPDEPSQTAAVTPRPFLPVRHVCPIPPLPPCERTSLQEALSAAFQLIKENNQNKLFEATVLAAPWKPNNPSVQPVSLPKDLFPPRQACFGDAQGNLKGALKRIRTYDTGFEVKQRAAQTQGPKADVVEVVVNGSSAAPRQSGACVSRSCSQSIGSRCSPLQYPTIRPPRQPHSGVVALFKPVMTVCAWTSHRIGKLECESMLVRTRDDIRLYGPRASDGAGVRMALESSRRRGASSLPLEPPLSLCPFLHKNTRRRLI